MNCGAQVTPYAPYAPNAGYAQYQPPNSGYTPYQQPYPQYPPYAYSTTYPPYAMPPYGPKPLSKGRAFWRGTLPVILFLVLQVVATLVALLVSVMAEFTIVFNEGLEAFLNALYNYDPTSTVLNGLLLSTTMSIILFSIMYFKQKDTFSIRQAGSPVVFPLAILLAIAGSFMLTTVLSVIQNLLGTDLLTSGLEFEDLSIEQAVLSMILVVFLVPVAEEICFRGLSQNHFHKRFSFWAANCLQAGFFGLVHGVPIQIGYAFLIGLLIGWMYHKSGRLSVAIIAHMAFNSGGYILEFIPNIDKVFDSIEQQMLYLFAPSLLVFIATLFIFAKTTLRKSMEN